MDTPATGGAKHPVAFLLSVWNERYIEQFFDFCLATLLAPGNIPAMAEEYDCNFVFLTDERDRHAFEKHPLMAELRRYCRITYVDIGDLIFGHNYSATLTIAYERGMRSAGTPVTGTYFIYLVSDYILAEHSLTGLMRYMKQGYSGITAGNFQIIEEDCRDDLREMRDPDTGIIAIPARELIGYSLHHLHPMTVANTVTQSLCHSQHSNRLFWKVDNQTLVGRFYLRHMLCIKPETDAYVIGSSCDYSFIPEFCPSGNVGHISDSDDYCVIELQPVQHERRFIKQGQASVDMLAESLGEWTTAEHRANAHHPVIFHASGLPAGTGAILEQSDGFIRAIEARLPAPQTARQHPYWTSCIEAVADMLFMSGGHEKYYRDGVFAGLFGSPAFGPALHPRCPDYLMLHTKQNEQFFSQRRQLWNRLLRFSGTFPNFKPWHPEWCDYRAIRLQLEELLKGKQACLFSSGKRTPVADWLHDRTDIDTHFQKFELLLLRPAAALKEQMQDIDLAVVALGTPQLVTLNKLISRFLQIFSQGGTLCLLVSAQGSPQFRNELASALTACIGPRVAHLEVKYISSPLRPYLDTKLFQAQRRLFSRRPRAISFALASLGVLGSLYLVNNLAGLLFPALCSRPASAIVTIRIGPSGQDDETANRLSRKRVPALPPAPVPAV